MPVQIGGGGDSVNLGDSSSIASVGSDGSVYAPMDSQVTFDNTGVQGMPTTQTYNGWGPVYGGGYSNAAQTAPSSGIAGVPAAGSPAGGGISGGSVGGGSGAAPGAAYTPPPPPIHHTYQEYLNNGSAVQDPTYAAQKAALLDKLNSYESQVAGQVGDQNLMQKSDPGHSLIGNYWAMKGLGSLYNPEKDQYGNITKYDSTGALTGGSLGTNFDTALANFDNQRDNGLRNMAEGFAARGMLGNSGSGNTLPQTSGVFQNARDNLDNQYTDQLNNLNTSTTQQYNNLLSNLANQYSTGQTTLNGYLGDAANRMATAANAGLPTS